VPAKMGNTAIFKLQPNNPTLPNDRFFWILEVVPVTSLLRNVRFSTDFMGAVIYTFLRIMKNAEPDMDARFHSKHNFLVFFLFCAILWLI
jgi:hypothetical protein